MQRLLLESRAGGSAHVLLRRGPLRRASVCRVHARPYAAAGGDEQKSWGDLGALRLFIRAPAGMGCLLLLMTGRLFLSARDAATLASTAVKKIGATAASLVTGRKEAQQVERRRQEDPAGAALVRCSARMAPSASHSTHSHFCTGTCLRRRARRLCARLPIRRRHTCRSWPVASFSGFWCCGASGGCGGCFRRQPCARGARNARTLLAARQHRF